MGSMDKAWQIPVTVIALTVGILLSTQIKSQAGFAQEELPSRRAQDLLIMLKDSDQQKADLESEVSDLRKQVADLADGKIPGKGLNNEMAMGDTALEGPGLKITLDDSSQPLQRGEDPNISIVHNDDLLRLVNELKSAGSEAVAINDQRLVSTSEIACAGTTILINKSRVAPPFVIRAIGNPDTMDSALTMRGGIVEYLQFYGIQVNIAKKSKVVLPAYSGSTLFKYAKPVPAKVTTS